MPKEFYRYTSADNVAIANHANDAAARELFAHHLRRTFGRDDAQPKPSAAYAKHPRLQHFVTDLFHWRHRRAPRAVGQDAAREFYCAEVRCKKD